MDSRSMIEGLERLKYPPMAEGGNAKLVNGSPRHIDFDALDILMDVGYVRGASDGRAETRDYYEERIEQLRDQLVKDALTQVLTWLVPLYGELEGVLIAPVGPDPERPDDEWADDRDERLQAIVDSFRRALPLLAHSASQDTILPPFLEGQVSLWREVHPVERVVDVEKVPAQALTNAQLEAVLTNDTDTFEHAGRVIVPEAIETLQQRAAASADMHSDGDPGVAAEILERHGLGVVDAEVVE